VNQMNLKHISKLLGLFSINSIAALLALVVVSGQRGLNGKRFETNNLAPINWSEAVNLLIYNSAGYDAAASVVAHVSNPR